MPTQPSPAVLPSDTRIGQTALRVNDLEAMTEFYGDVVGLCEIHRSDARSILGAGATPLLVLERHGDALERMNSGAGLFHNAFRVPTREALGDALVRIRDHWQLGGASDHGVSEALYLSDPEGNGIEIYRDFPREKWPFTADGSLRMGTSPLELDSVEAAAAGNADLPAGTDVGHVHLEVTSLDEFRDFYVDVIGFEVQMSVPAALFVSAGGYHHHIGANTWNHRARPAAGRGLAWFEVILPEPEVFDVIRERLRGTRYSVSAVDDGFAVTGPDAIEVRFRI